MASKKKRGGNDFDWDSDLDFDIPDFGGDNPEVVSDNRKPIATGLRSAAEGFGKTFTNEARLRRTLTKSLPREYEEPISKAFEIKDGVRDLYNITTSQVSETVRETKRSVGRIARNLESTLPKGVYNKLTGWAATADEDRAGVQSKDELEQGTINNAMLEIFAETAKADADNRKKDQARGVLQDAIDKKRHEDMTSILGSIDQSLISMQSYQERVGTNYMKKSLELQFRSYFVQNDMLQLQTKYFQLFKDDFAAITKNTGLPDYVKKAPKEALMERLRERMFDSLGNTISRKRSQWMSGVFNKAGNKIRDTFQDFRDGASQIFDTAEMATSMYGSGMGPSAPEFAGEIAGTYAGNRAQDLLAKKIREHIKKNPKAVKLGNKLGMIFNNLPQWVNKEVTTGQHADKIPDWLKDILAQDQERSGIAVNREVDLERAAQFSDKNSRSLNVVIPELLSKIHHELYVTRTGDVSSKPLAYDYEKGKFVTKEERQKGLANTIVSERTVEQTKHQVDSIFKEIDPSNTLPQEERAKIAERIYAANKRGTMFDKSGMLMTTEHDGVNSLIRNYLDGDPSGGRERRLSGAFGRVGGNNGEVSDLIQELVDNGRHGELAEMGLIDLKRGTINLDMIRKMELGQDISNPAAPTNPDPRSAAPNRNRGPNPIRRPLPSRQGGFLNLDAFTRSRNNQNDSNPVPENASLPDLTRLFREAIESLQSVRSSGSIDDRAFTQLKETIEKASGKTELAEIRDILKRIEEKGIQGGGVMSPEMLEQYMSERVGGFFGKAGQLFGKGAKGVAGIFGKGMQGSWKQTKRLYNWATSGPSMFDWLAKQKDKFDLFVGNEVEPRLSKAKMAAGRYVDEATGKVIEKFEDIQGSVKDLDTGEIVLKATEIRDAILKNMETGKSVLARFTGWGKKSIEYGLKKAKEVADGVFGLSKTVYGMGWTGLKKAYEFLTDGPMDVYLKDNYETPVLLKRLMSQGLYFDKDSLDAIYKVSDIKGPVVDNQNNVLITKEDLHNGLYDKDGKEIKTGFDKVLQFVGGSIKKTLNTYKRILNGAKDMGSRAMAWIKGLFGFESPFTVFSQRTNDILSAIYSLLNDRMPGEKSPDIESATERVSSAKGGAKAVAQSASKAFEAAKEKMKHAKAKAEVIYENRDEHWETARDEVRKRTGRAKSHAEDTWDKLYKLMDERLPQAKKKIFGDADGDGDRDGDVDDIRSRRQKLKDAAKEAKDKATEKFKGTSAYEALAKLLKSKKKDEDEEDDDDDGSILDNLFGDDSGDSERDKKRKRRLKRMRRNKPRGRLGSAWDKLRGKLPRRLGGLAGAAGTAAEGALESGAGAVARNPSTVARAAGGFGRVALALGGFLGRAALGVGGAIIGGGLSSASILGGGLSMLGSVLGMTATAIGAIISSPITVPLLAAAAIGTAGYFAYKWLTKPDPQALEKVRLVQYGWKAKDIDAYKKMKSIEHQVASAVSFKGENAEFDPKRLNIPELMKIYNLDPTNQDHAKKFVDWFANRFRPVYLHHRALIKTLNSPKELDVVDDNKPDFKKQYLDQCLFPGDHYWITTNPFKDQAFLFTTQGTVEREIEIAKADIEKEGSKKPDDKKDKPNAVATALAAQKAKEALANQNALHKEVQKDKSVLQGVPNKLGASPERTAEINRLRAATIGSTMGPGSLPGNPINGPSGAGGASTQGDATFPRGINVKQPGNGTGGDINAIPIPKGNGSWDALKNTVVAAAKMAGVDPKLAAAITAVESGFDYTARPMDKRTGRLFSSAKGLNQFLDGTWNNMMDKYAMKYGIAPDTSALDPRANALLGAEFLKENSIALKKTLGRDVTATDVYLAHFMGLGGAKKFLTSDPNAAGAALFPEAARANPWIYYKDPSSLSGPKTLGEIYNDFTQKLSKKLTTAGYSDSDIAGVGTDPTKTKEENAKLQESQESGGPGTVRPSALVASPKPTVPNVIANNPNMGPTPSTFSPKPVTPATLVASPRPSYDPSSTSASAPVARASAPASQDAYYQTRTNLNTGDSFEIMKKSLGEQQKQSGLLERIANAIDGLPEATAKALSGVLPAASAKEVEKPSESNNYNKPPSAMPKASIAFRRQMTGN
jgi:hypothetical protein